MAKPSKKHHFVPRSILKNFTIDSAGSTLYVYDKSSGRSFQSSLMDAGSENKFNTVEIDGMSLNFESIFDEADSALAAVTARLLAVRNLKVLTAEDITTLKRLVIVQFLRTKINRDTIVHIETRKKEIIDGVWENFTHDISVPNSEEAKLLATNEMFEIEKYLPSLNNKLLFLFETNLNDPFIISDNPIVIQNYYPFGGRTLSDSGVEIYFPISADLCVVFWCSSILADIHREKPALANTYNEILLSGKPINIPQSEVEQFNTSQLAYCSRFIYSTQDQKAWADAFLEKYPKYKKVETKFTLGEMGEGPPPKPNMPRGDYLVVFTTKQNFMVPIILFPDLFSITFTTEDYTQLKMIEEDVPIIKAEVYRDGKVIRSIPRGVLRYVDYTGKQPNKIGYDDPSIEGLLSSILNSKTK